MKKKTKIVTMAEIAIVLCSLFLVASPAIAAEQTTQEVITTASEDDYVLGVYGNANEDDTIDMRDLTYVKLIFFGKKPETELADAKYDGKLNPLDFIQIKLIIVGKEKELTIRDGNGEEVTVCKPVERIVVEFFDSAELMMTLNAEEKVVGVSSRVAEQCKDYLQELSKLPGVGLPWRLDYEAVLNLHPDVLLTFGAKTDEKKEKLPGVTVIYLGLYHPDLLDPEGSRFTDGVRKLGYILDKEKEAEEYVKWRIGWINEIKSRTEALSEDQKTRVFHYASPHKQGYTTYTKGYKADQMSFIAGGKNIAEDIDQYWTASSYTMNVDPEWVVEQNPDFIIAQVVFEDVAHGYGTDDPSEMAALRENILNRPELAKINAVKAGNIYIMASPLRNDGTGYFIGAAYMAKWFHPELFEDLDPQAIHQEYLNRFIRTDYDLDDHGVFVYPPLR